MKIAQLTRRARLSPLKEQVLRYLEAHPREVFGYRDESLARALRRKQSAVNFTLWVLHRDGLVDKEEVDGKVYFGSRRAVAHLRARLGLADADPFQRARALRDQVWRRTGEIDVVELLDGVRGPWN